MLILNTNENCLYRKKGSCSEALTNGFELILIITLMATWKFKESAGWLIIINK